MEEKLDIEFGNDFLDVTSKVQATKVKTEKLGHVILKPSECHRIQSAEYKGYLWNGKQIIHLMRG